jgi:ligand-binding sensor domain-containing protein
MLAMLASSILVYTRIIIVRSIYPCIVSVYLLPMYSNADDLIVPRYAGNPRIHNYTHADFGPHSQHWAIAELPTGEFIIGNHGGYNLYDGATWRRKTINNYTVASIDVGSDGRAYIGGTLEFGYLAPDSLGDLEFRSLTPYVPERFMRFTYVRGTYAMSNGPVYFHAREYLFRWDGESVTVWEPETSFHSSFSVYNKLYLWQPDHGLYAMEGDSVVPVPGGERFAGHPIAVMLPWDEESILIGTRTDGFYVFDGDIYESFPVEAHAYISSNYLYTGDILGDGTIVLGTLRGGLIQIDRHGVTLRVLNRNSGLQDQTVFRTYIDVNGMLWLCLNNGLSTVDMMSPVTFFDEHMGLTGLVTASLYFDNTIYAGTTSGLYRLREERHDGVPNFYFEAVDDIRAFVWTIVKSGSRLFVTTVEGLFIYAEDGTVEKVFDGDARGAAVSERTSDVYVSLNEQILSLRITNDEVGINGTCGSIPWSVYQLIEDRLERLWVATIGHGVFKLDWEMHADMTGMKYVSEAVHLDVPYKDELPQTSLFLVKDEIRVISTAGILQYNDESQMLVPDAALSRILDEHGIQPYLAIEDGNGSIWLRSIRDSYRLDRLSDDRYAVYEGKLRQISGEIVDAIYPAADKTVWFSGSAGMARYDATVDYSIDRDYRAYVREVTINTDSSLYTSYSRERDNLLRLRSIENNLRFRFSIPAFDQPGRNAFQVRLEPVDSEWSRWSNEWYKDYTNLREGKYRFTVRGRDMYGNVSRSAAFEFRILPPWYRTWWAYMLMMFFVGVLLFTAHRYRVGRVLKIERTRTRIARDLHDDIGSRLSSIALMIDMLIKRGRLPDDANDELQNISGTTRDMIDSLRDVVWVIDPEHDKLGTMVDRMKATADTMLQNVDRTFQTDISGVYEQVSMDFKRSVLLIFKETLTNIVKHARASNVQVSVTEYDGVFRMVVRDDGIGFDTAGTYDGNGLKNMKYRAEQIYGALTIHSDSDSGTTIDLTVELM